MVTIRWVPLRSALSIYYEFINKGYIPMSRLRFFPVLLLLVFIAFPAASLAAGKKYLFKIGSLAPEGSVWARYFKEFADEVREKTGGAVRFRVYPGGVMGDDRSMYRKMRIGQLHGGGFTMNGISEIVPDFRVMGIPFLFRSYEEVDRVAAGLMPMFRKKFSAKGLELLATTEVGFIYTMSKAPVDGIASLKQRKAWAPENDPVSLVFLKNIGVTPVLLSIPDVMSSLETGLIDTVFNSFYGAIVMQWFTKTKYITDIPFGYAYGALVLSKRAFGRLPPEYARICRAAAAHHFPRLIAAARKSNADSLAALKKQGVRLVAPRPGEVEKLARWRDRTVKELNGRIFSKGVYEKTMRILAESRGTGAR